MGDKKVFIFNNRRIGANFFCWSIPCPVPCTTGSAKREKHSSMLDLGKENDCQ